MARHLAATRAALRDDGGHARFVLPEPTLGVRVRLNAWIFLIGIGLMAFGYFTDHHSTILLWTFNTGYVGLLFLGIGVAWLCRRAEITLTRDRLCCIYRLGPLRWTRRRRIQHIKRIVLCPDMVAVYAGDKHPEFADLCHLVVDCGRSTASHYVWWAWTWELLRLRNDTRMTLHMAGHHQRAALEAVARAVGRRFPDIEIEGVTAPAAQSSETANPAHLKPADVPEGSVIQCSRRPDGATIIVPTDNYGVGIMLLAAVFLCFFSLALGISVFGHLSGAEGFAKVSKPHLYGFLGTAWLLALYAIYAGYRLMHQKVFFSVEQDRLRYKKTGVFRSERREWRRQDLADISAVGLHQQAQSRVSDWAHAGWQYFLCIRTRDGKIVHLFHGATQAGLAGPDADWLASTLSRLMRVGR